MGAIFDEMGNLDPVGIWRQAAVGAALDSDGCGGRGVGWPEEGEGARTGAQSLASPTSRSAEKPVPAHRLDQPWNKHSTLGTFCLAPEEHGKGLALRGLKRYGAEGMVEALEGERCWYSR